MPTVRVTTCCGLAEISEVSYASQTGLRDAIARARGHNCGRVFATTAQGLGEENLAAVGFHVVEEFRNPNTGHQVKLWLRSTAAPKPAPSTAKRILTSLSGRKVS